MNTTAKVTAAMIAAIARKENGGTRPKKINDSDKLYWLSVASGRFEPPK